MPGAWCERRGSDDERPVAQFRRRRGVVHLHGVRIASAGRRAGCKEALFSLGDQPEQAQGQLSSALSRLLVVVERYPNLTATENFRDLQAQLEGTENRISVERRDFNQAVQNYDTAIKSFPAVFYASAFGFQYKPYFAAEPGAETAPKVQFNFGNPATNAP